MVSPELAEQTFRAYLEVVGIEAENGDRPPFRPTTRRMKQPASNAVSSKSICELVKWRLKDAGMPNRLSPCSFRASGITYALGPGMLLNDVQYLAGDSRPRTTKLYHRRQKQVTRNSVERISI